MKCRTRKFYSYDFDLWRRCRRAVNIELPRVFRRVLPWFTFPQTEHRHTVSSACEYVNAVQIVSSHKNVNTNRMTWRDRISMWMWYARRALNGSWCVRQIETGTGIRLESTHHNIIIMLMTRLHTRNIIFKLLCCCCWIRYSFVYLIM